MKLEGNNVEGKLCMKYPWPSMARTIYGDHQRFKDTYFSAFPRKIFYWRRLREKMECTE